MARKEIQERVDELALAVATLRRDIDEAAPATEIERIDEALHALGDLRELIANRAPITEVERLDTAFDELAAKAPASEVSRLDTAFTQIAQLQEQVADLTRTLQQVAGASGSGTDAAAFAPASEVERLSAVYDLLADKAPASEIARLDAVYDALADKAPASEIARLDLAFEELARRATKDELAQVSMHVSEQVNSERNVEIPWAISRYRGETDVLEVGIANAEPRYLDALRALEIPRLVGLDLAEIGEGPRRIAEVVNGDVRDPSNFAEAQFDLILCISTLEHIGRDNSVYGIDEGIVAGGDAQALRSMAHWLRPQGRLLLSVPYGTFQDHGWFVNYDAAHLAEVVAAAGLQVASESYWELRGGWSPLPATELVNRGYRTLGAPHAGGVALLELVHGS